MLKKLTPNLMVEDVNRTIEFYRDVLGFEVTATVPEEGIFGWANTRHGEVEIMFQARLSLEEEVPALKGQPVGGSLTFYIDAGEQVKTLYEQLKDKVELAQDLHTTFYDATEFAIIDCNGYILAFAGPV
jgi:uncharacterized glyoxalase superfamily protein PhnB